MSVNHSPESRVPSLLLLSVASGLSPFGMAVLVPALNSIALRFDADFASVQFVISAYLLGLAAAQPAFGFLCDRFGRRPIMLIGFAAFTVTSLLCAIADTLPLLIIARFFQAVSVSVGTVASRAILRDTYDHNRMAEAMSYVAAVMGLSPIMAPVIGGVLDATVSYASIFLATSAIGGVVFLSMYFGLSETLPAEFSKPQLRVWVQGYRHLFRSRSFLGNTFLFGFVQGGFFCFMAIGASLFATEFQIESGLFGLMWGLMALNYVAGATLAAKVTPFLGTRKVLHVSVVLGVVSGFAVWAAASFGELTVYKVLVPLGFLMMVAGSTSPGAMAGAVADHPTRAGTASGLSSAIGLVVSGTFAIIAGNVYDGDYQLIAAIMALSSIAAAASWWLATLSTRASL